MKKIFSIILFFSVLISSSGVALAQITQNSAPKSNAPQYTKEQQACIKEAQAARAAAVKAAADTLNTATKDALQIKKDALAAAQKIKDAKAKTAAIKAANDAYNNDPVVKEVRVPYADAVKAANDKFQSDQKLCVAESHSILGLGFLKKIKGNVSNTFSNWFQKIKQIIKFNK